MKALLTNVRKEFTARDDVFFLAVNVGNEEAEHSASACRVQDACNLTDCRPETAALLHRARRLSY
jgi:hypothetical protein